MIIDTEGNPIPEGKFPEQRLEPKREYLLTKEQAAAYSKRYEQYDRHMCWLHANKKRYCEAIDWLNANYDDLHSEDAAQLMHEIENFGNMEDGE